MPGFQDLGLSRALLQAIHARHYREPTPIQTAAIPPMLAGRDLLVQAPTGTGKTAAFAIPLVERAKHGALGAIVMVPTRELAIQVAEEAHALGRDRSVRALAAYGGVSINPQADALKANEVEILVATPGRLLDLIMQPDAPPMERVQRVVIDEADRMLDMGFIEMVDRILTRLPKQRQTVLASATLPTDVKALARRILRDPLTVDVSGTPAPTALADQRYLIVEEGRKLAAVKAYLDAEDPFDILLFANTRDRADLVAEGLRKLKVDVAVFHGGIQQNKRERALEAFRDGKARVLVATDVASRGIDVRGIACVLNYDVPEDQEAYIHRVGRTGRAGKRGVALTFITPYERDLLRYLEGLAGGPLERQRLPDF